MVTLPRFVPSKLVLDLAELFVRSDVLRDIKLTWWHVVECELVLVRILRHELRLISEIILLLLHMLSLLLIVVLGHGPIHGQLCLHVVLGLWGLLVVLLVVAMKGWVLVGRHECL